LYEASLLFYAKLMSWRLFRKVFKSASKCILVVNRRFLCSNRWIFKQRAFRTYSSQWWILSFQWRNVTRNSLHWALALTFLDCWSGKIMLYFNRYISEIVLACISNKYLALTIFIFRCKLRNNETSKFFCHILLTSKQRNIIELTMR
jgi:hypothetical protein